MIVGSLLLILVGAGLLVAGLVGASDALLIASIGVSLVAAILLYLGARQSAAVLATDGPAQSDRAEDDRAERDRAERDRAERDRAERDRAERDRAERDPAPRDALDRMDTVEIPTARDGSGDDQDEEPPGETDALDGVDEVAVDDDDPADEPPAQVTSAADTAKLERSAAEVIVIDGRPRYHRAGCVHLLGRASEALPISEAIELGFTPCGLCEPDTELLAERSEA